ncbi:MAG: T9SS type B sorting domain-containing protein [Burkholderiales bacterium]|nr:T9SS type B sorting domain-containing protein [Flavobacterium sp.]
MKKIIFFGLLFFGSAMHAQLMIDDTAKTPAQLVRDVLVGLGVTPLNIKFNGTAANANQVKDQVAEFNTNFNQTNMGIKRGVLMTTGKAMFAMGPNTSHNNLGTGQIFSSSPFGVDPDLQQLSGSSISSSAILEFDFLATGLEVNFDFVFGSEEYAGYVNFINDTFGFFLSGPGITGLYSNNAKNIALVPNTNIPISIDTVNNGPNNNGSCTNCAYYFNNGPFGMNPNNSSVETVEYDGFTTVLTATSAIQCGETYHIKLAIGNVTDNYLDSGVFLKNFRIDPLVLVDDFNLANNKNVCFGETVIINSGLIVAPNTFEWLHNGVVLPGENSEILSVTTGGTYSLNVYTPSNCLMAHDDIGIAFLPETPIVLPVNNNICTLLPPPYNFNIDQTAAVLGPLDPLVYLVSYYSTNANNEAYNGSSVGLIPDADLSNYIISSTAATIWVRVESSLSGCIVVKPFTLSASPSPSGTFSYPVAAYCTSINTLQTITTSVTTGGVYSAMPSGLSIDSATGQINPSLSLPGNYTVNYNLAASGNCAAFSAGPVPIRIDLTPIAPLFTIVQPNCTVTNGSITITSPLGANLEYSIDNGVTFQSNPIFAAITSGSYNVVVSNAISQCTSTTVIGVINPLLGVPTTPTVSITFQPTCFVPSATLVVTAPIGANLQYSIDGGLAYQSSPIFSALAANTSYGINVKDMVTGCVSTITQVVINPLPSNPSPASGIISQPNCLVTSGTIAISAPLGTNLEYSANSGATYQSGISFVGLSPNVYNITVKDMLTGCISAPSAFVVNAIPANPGQPVGIVSQPSCILNTGSFNVTSPVGLNLEYSSDGGNTYQNGVSFTGLNAATSYSVVVRNNLTSCVSISAVVTIDPVLPIPVAPTGSTTFQPTCNAPTGVIQITAPIGINLEYSINGGITYQSATVFSGLAPNATYNITVKNNVSGCISSATTVTVNAISLPPAAPTATTLIQPTCTIATGTIVISSPLGTSFEYSNDGGTSYQNSLTFSGLTPNNTYSITVRDVTTGCISLATAVVVNSIPTNPAAPTATVTQPTCLAAAKIVVTAPLGTDLEYSIDGGISYQNPVSFLSVLPNTIYGITVRNRLTGCISSAASFVVNPIPTNPPVPLTVVTQPTCATNTGSFIVASPLGMMLEYSVNGGTTYQSSVSFVGLNAASYNVIVRNMVTGCISSSSSVVITPALSVPIAPIASITIAPTCSVPTATAVVSAPLGINFQYSNNNGITYQNSPIFAALLPNTTYSLTVRNVASGCVSPATTFTIAALPSNPAAPSVTISQPNCYNPTATIQIISPLGTNFEYSSNNGVTYQTDSNFSGIAPNNSYTITARNNITGCVSLATVVTVNPMPQNPLPATASIVQPTCANPFGSISITTPIGTNTLFSIDGGLTYQSSPIFIGLIPNRIYDIMVKNNSTGCVSNSASFSINSAPTIPPAPVVMGSDVCVGESIALTTTAVVGASYLWSGPNGYTSSVQNPIILGARTAMGGNYSLIIYFNLDCLSFPGAITVVVHPQPFPQLQNGYVCVDSSTNAVLTPYILDSHLSNTSHSFEWFRIDNGVNTLIPFENQSFYPATAAGVYGVIATNAATNCVSSMVTASVNLAPTPATISVVSSEYFADNQIITVMVSPAGNYQYQLDNGAFQSNYLFSNVAAGHHDVVVRSECGEYKKEIDLLNYPRYFTPNGDGYNDTWNIFDLKGQAKAKIYIFDRFGKLLKEITPLGLGWDGTFNQQSLPSSDYWFIVHYEENTISKIFRSHFALKR